MKSILLGAAFVLAGQSAQAAPSASKVKLSEMSPIDAPELWVNAAEAEKMKKAALERGKDRSIASNVIAGEDLLSPEFKSFRSRFLNIKDPAQLDAILVELDQNYESYPSDLKLAALTLTPLRSLRSIVYRMAPLFERARLTHSVLLTAVRQMAVNVQGFFPLDQWDSGFRYVTEPFASSTARFKSESDYQRFLCTEMLAQLKITTGRLKRLDLSARSGVVADNQLLYGKASFEDSIDRYRVMGEAERYLALANLHGASASIAATCAYNVNKAIAVAEDLGKLYGVDGWGPANRVEGAPSASRVAVLRKSGYADFLTLKDNGTEWMQLAFKHLSASTTYASTAWSEIKNRSLSESWMIDSRFAAPLNRVAGLSLDSVQAMVKGRTDIRSIITQEVMTVDLPAFYSNPPKDLKALLPTQFEDGPEKLSKSVTENGAKHRIDYRNYLRGRATNWNLAAYRAYFPSLKNGEDVPWALRILSQAWGGGAGAFMFGVAAL